MIPALASILTIGGYIAAAVIISPWAACLILPHFMLAFYSGGLLSRLVKGVFGDDDELHATVAVLWPVFWPLYLAWRLGSGRWK